MAKIPVPLNICYCLFNYVKKVSMQKTLLTSNLTFDYLGKYNAGSIVITIPGNNGLDFDTVGVSCTSIPR